MADEMNTAEVARLIEWLKANGHTPSGILDCIMYIGKSQPPNKEKPTADTLNK